MTPHPISVDARRSIFNTCDTSSFRQIDDLPHLFSPNEEALYNSMFNRPTKAASQNCYSLVRAESDQELLTRLENCLEKTQYLFEKSQPRATETPAAVYLSEGKVKVTGFDISHRILKYCGNCNEHYLKDTYRIEHEMRKTVLEISPFQIHQYKKHKKDTLDTLKLRQVLESTTISPPIVLHTWKPAAFYYQNLLDEQNLLQNRKIEIIAEWKGVKIHLLDKKDLVVHIGEKAPETLNALTDKQICFGENVVYEKAMTIHGAILDLEALWREPGMNVFQKGVRRFIQLQKDDRLAR